jgi:NADH-quinone oxidoreductase subunit M
MILLALIVVTLAGGIAAWLLEGVGPRAPRWACLVALAVDAALVVHLASAGGDTGGPWTVELQRAWIPRFGVSLHLAADGLSLLLLALTVLLGVAAVAASWTEVGDSIGLFHFNLMAVLAGVMGVFTAVDLFLFAVFWEVMLVPMALLIALWGHENRQRAAVKFFIFTQAGGLLMLLSIIGLGLEHLRLTGTPSFDLADLVGMPLSPQTALWLMLGFAAAFAVKLPVVPIHTWLPDAHTEAPTAGSMILAGLLLKTGGYGFLRFVLPLFPGPARAVAPIAMALGVAGILYGGLLAFAQSDLKRLVAYTSVSHLGFVLVGAFSGNALALQGAMLQMICHGLGTGALFLIAGALQERVHTRDMDRMGGLWAAAPRMGGFALLFAMAALGLPGLGNFLAEFLVLLGVAHVSLPLAIIASFGFVVAAVYGLWLVQRTFHGPLRAPARISDLGMREAAVLAGMAIVLLWLGVAPQPVLATASAPLARIAATVAAGR